jgi:hypothetical protein
MSTIPPNNTSGLYGIDGNAIPVGNDVNANNITASGNVTVGGYIVANGSITTNANFVGDLVGNVTGNITLAGSNTQVIYNDQGVTGGSNAFTFNDATNVVSVGGNITATGNIQGSYILGNGSQLTGLPQSYTNANVVTLLAAFGSNTINTTGNITGGYILGNGSQLTGLPQQYGNANVAAFLDSGTNTLDIITTGTVEGSRLQTSGAAGNITGANYIGANFFVGDGSLLTNVATTYGNTQVSNYLASGTNTGNIVTTANISGQYILGNGSQLTGLGATYSNANVTTLLASFGSNTISTSGNITGGNIIGNGQALTNLPAANIVGTVANAAYATNAGSATVANSANSVAGANVTGTVDSATQAATANVANSVAGGNVTGQVANALVAGTVYTAAQPNITSVGTLTSLSVTGNTSTGGIKTDNFYYANGTPISFAGTYGDSNVTTLLSSFGSNSISTTGNVTAGNVAGNGAGLSNLTGANVSGQVANALVAGTVYTAAQPAITSVGTLTSLSVTGNVTGGNILSSTFQAVNSGGGTLKNASGASQIQWGGGGGNNVSIDVATNINPANAAVAISPTGSGTVRITPAGGGAMNNMIIGNITPAAANVTTLGTTGNITAAGILTDGYYYANGTPVTFGGGGTYGDSNVNTLLASWGSNTLSTTGNVSVGNLNMTGRVFDTSGVFQVNAAGNIVLVPTGSVEISGPTVITGGKLTTGAVTYANTDGTAGQVLTTYGNGVTYFSTVAGGSYGDSNVNTLLASWGSNTLTTTGNVSAGNLAVTGANAQLRMAGTTSNKINFGTTGYGPPIYGTYSNGAKIVLYDSISNTNAGYAIGIDSYTMWFNTDIPGSNFEYFVGNAKVAAIEANGTVTAGAVNYTATDGTAGQVLTTYGNGVTYFSTVSGGGNGSPGGANTQIQFNDAGAFAGNAAMTFNKVTGNTTLGNIVLTTNQQLETVSAFSGNSSVRNPGQITVGDGYAGNITNTTYLTASARGARLLSYDQYVKADNGQRNAQLASLSFADLNGSTTYGTANANSRIVGITNELFVINGNTVQSNPNLVRSAQNLLFVGTSANVGNANVSGAVVNYSFAQTNNGSRLGNAWINLADSTNGSATLSPIDTWIGYGVRPNHTANTTSGNIFGVYMPGVASTYGQSISNISRAAGSYYFLRCDDDLAQNKLGSLRTFHEYRYDNSPSAGTLTIDKNNGQVQYVTLSADVTTVAFSNFVVSASDGTTTDYQMDTVTVVFQQDATGRTVTLPTPSATYKYAAGLNTMGTTANAVQMISISAVYNATLAGTQYLITVSPEFG